MPWRPGFVMEMMETSSDRKTRHSANSRPGTVCRQTCSDGLAESPTSIGGSYGCTTGLLEPSGKEPLPASGLRITASEPAAHIPLM